MDNVKLDFLKNIELFSGLDEAELAQISGKVVLKEFKKNEVILYEEDTSVYMYIVLFGKVIAVKTTEDGKEIILAAHQSGEFFGEMSLIDGRTSPATVMATENSLVAIVSKKDFFSLLKDYDKVLESLLRVLCFRIRDSWTRIHMLNFKNAAQRIKMLFLTLSFDRGLKEADGVKLNIKLTHQNIADMIGLTRETVTRVLDKWQKDGEIKIKNKYVHLSARFLQKGVEM